MRSRPRWPARRTSGSRVTAAAPTPRGTPGRSPRTRRASRARCRSIDPGSGTGRMLALDLDGPRRGAADGAAVQHDRTVAVEVATQAGRSPGSSPGAAARSSPTSRRAAAATSTSCSPRRCPGASCATSAGRWRSGSRRSTRRRCPRLGGQISPPGSRHKSGGWRVLSTPVDIALAAVEQPNEPEVWTALLTEFAAELRRSKPVQALVRQFRAEPSWTTPASRGCPASAAARPSALSLTVRPAPAGGTGRAMPTAARPAWRSWPQRRPAAGGWPTCGRRSTAEPGRAWPRCMSGPPSPGGWTGSCRTSGEKRSPSSAGRKTYVTGSLATVTTPPCSYRRR